MQSKVPSDMINRLRDFASDMASEATLSELRCHLTEDHIAYGMGCSVSEDEFDYMSPTLVPKDIREDYALKFIEWTFDDTVCEVSLHIDYYSITLTVNFIGGEAQSFSQRFEPEPRDDEPRIIKIRDD